MTRYYKPGESFCLYDAAHSDFYAWSTEPSIIFVGTDGKAVVIREGSAYICIRSRSNPAFRHCWLVTSTYDSLKLMSITLCDEDGILITGRCCWQYGWKNDYKWKYH